MSTVRLDAIAQSALTGMAPNNDATWAPSQMTCSNTECGAFLYPLYRSHCRFCGQFFCSNCVRVLTAPPVSVGVCADAPVSGECKSCAPCAAKARSTDAFFEALRVLLVLVAGGAHFREWHALCEACPPTTPLGLAARYLLHTFNRANGKSARFGSNGFNPSDLDRQLVAASGPSARAFDLVYDTRKARTRIASHGNDILLDVPLTYFVPILAHGVLDGRWATEMMQAVHPESWACIMPCIHPRVRANAFEQAARTQRRAAYLNGPAAGRCALSKAAHRHEDVRQNLEMVLTHIVIPEDKRADWWQADAGSADFGDLGDFGDFILDMPVVYVRGEAVSLTGARAVRAPDGNVEPGVVQLTVGTEAPVVARFTDCPFDMARASALLDPPSFNDTFLRQVLLGPAGRRHRALVSRSLADGAPATDPMVECSDASIHFQCLLLTLLQAGHRRFIDRTKLRTMGVQSTNGGPHCLCYHVEFLPEGAPNPQPVALGEAVPKGFEAVSARGTEVLNLFEHAREACHWANVLMHSGPECTVPDLPATRSELVPFLVQSV